MGKKEVTLVGLLLDETGSMVSVKQQTIDGVNEYLDTLMGGKNIKLTIVTFNSKEQFRVLYKSVKPKKADKFTAESYKPDNMTPLHDATAAMVRHMRLVEMAEKKDGKKPKVMVAIMTDGLENASTEYTLKDINSLISKMKKKGWEFAFLGANQDAFVTGGAMGIPLGNCATYSSGCERGTLYNTAMAAVSFSLGETKSGELFAEVDESKWKIEVTRTA